VRRAVLYFSLSGIGVELVRLWCGGGWLRGWAAIHLISNGWTDVDSDRVPASNTTPTLREIRVRWWGLAVVSRTEAQTSKGPMTITFRLLRIELSAFGGATLHERDPSSHHHPKELTPLPLQWLLSVSFSMLDRRLPPLRILCLCEFLAYVLYDETGRDAEEVASGSRKLAEVCWDRLIQ